MLAFSHQESHKLKPISLSEVIDGLTFLRALIPVSVEVLKTTDNKPLIIDADKIQLQQLLINLWSNAVHAMNEKGLM